MGQMLPTPGFCDELQHVYLARDLDFGENHPDADEFLEVVKLPLQEAEEMAVDGRLEDSKTVAAILRACRVLEREDFHAQAGTGLQNVICPVQGFVQKELALLRADALYGFICLLRREIGLLGRAQLLQQPDTGLGPQAEKPGKPDPIQDTRHGPTPAFFFIRPLNGTSAT